MDRRLFLAFAGGLLASRSAGPGAARRPPPRRAVCASSTPHTGETFDGPYRDDRGPIGVGDGGAVVLPARLSFRRADRDRCRRPRFSRGGDGRGRRQPRHHPVGLSHAGDQRDAGAHHLRRGRQQPASLRPRARHPPRYAARGGDAGGARDAARRRRLVPAFRVHPPRQRAGAQLDARRPGLRRAAVAAARAAWRTAASRAT